MAVTPPGFQSPALGVKRPADGLAVRFCSLFFLLVSSLVAMLALLIAFNGIMIGVDVDQDLIVINKRLNHVSGAA